MDTDILVIGAGPAGLAVAGALAMRGRHAELIERANDVGAAWRGHYERLHLHTVKTHSALPGLAFADAAPRYVPRSQVVAYLDSYAQAFAIRPRFGEEAIAVMRRDGGWHVTTQPTHAPPDGRAWRARFVVVATGANAVPLRPRLDGEDDFGGRIVHSREYRDAKPFTGQRVLVVGMGNTGAEIALDLALNGVRASLSVRSPVNIVRRDVLGRPTQLTALALSRLPTRLGDWIARVLRDLTVGRLERFGLETSKTSPLADLRERGRTPLIDVGTLARIRSGEIVVHPAIDRVEQGGVRFAGGTRTPFDAIVLATGYRAAVDRLFPGATVPVDEHGLPTQLVGTGALNGAFFVGFDTRQAGGLLRTIGQQAIAVAERIDGAARAARAATGARVPQAPAAAGHESSS